MGFIEIFLFMLTALPSDFLGRLEKHEVKNTDRVLVVSISHQRMTLFEGRMAMREYVISTAQNGIGQRENTNQTPLGLHRIGQKIGGDAPIGAIFESRVFTGEIWRPMSVPAMDPSSHAEISPPVLESSPNTTELITSRILWLEGLESGFNQGRDAEGFVVDSHERYIYIHGTNHEDEIGRPVSKGCIRMTNPMVLELFDRVQEGDLVWIEE